MRETSSETVTGANGQVAVLERALWRQLSDNADPQGFAKAWLALQCQMLADVRRGLLVLSAASGEPLAPAAQWPVGDTPDPALMQVAEEVLREGLHEQGVTPSPRLMPVSLRYACTQR